MQQVIGDGGGVPPDGMPPHLVVKTGKNWRYDEGRNRFVRADAEEFDPYPGLPAGSRIVPMVPDLARADPRRLSADERNLARYLHLILPAGAAAGELLEAVGAWPSVEEARLPPEVSLPE